VTSTSENGATVKTFTLTITREPSTVATLSGLTVDGHVLSPTFASGTTAYTLSVPNGTAQVAIAPTCTEPCSSITVNTETVQSGNPKIVQLDVSPKTVAIEVTAQDGVTKTTYNVVVTVAPAAP
jgi:hypothetical protein